MKIFLERENITCKMTWHRNYVAFIEQTWTWKSSPLVYCNGLYLSGLLHSVWEDLEASGGEEVGGGIGMGNTCKSMADSFQCMTKPTTIKLKKKKKRKICILKKREKEKAAHVAWVSESRKDEFNAGLVKNKWWPSCWAF